MPLPSRFPTEARARHSGGWMRPDSTHPARLRGGHPTGLSKATSAYREIPGLASNHPFDRVSSSRLHSTSRKPSPLAVSSTGQSRPPEDAPSIGAARLQRPLPSLQEQLHTERARAFLKSEPRDIFHNASGRPINCLLISLYLAMRTQTPLPHSEEIALANPGNGICPPRLSPLDSAGRRAFFASQQFDRVLVGTYNHC